MPLIYISLVDEGTDVARPTEAVELGDGLFRVLSTPDYDPDDEIWEFPPGSIVRLEEKTKDGYTYWVAVRP